MDTARAERADAVVDGAVVDGAAALPLVRAAAALRWSRPDLTATLAELALEAAPDAATWVAAAGWLLHGRATLGDGRDTACALLDGLARWGQPVAALLDGPEGRRLRVELAGPARRIGETSAARALLMSVRGADEGDLELRADVLTELARCAVDAAPDTVDDALSAAEAAWRAAASAPGVASVTLLRSARSRRADRPDEAVVEAVDGLSTVNARGRLRGATASDHLAAALTAEWIAALVDADRLDEARGEGLAAANRLVATARASRQVAGLRLAIARVTAVDESPDAVLAALEPAAQMATDSDVPELESACRSMLGELHEAAGRLDAALAALRVAMSAERRDRERAAQLRARLAAMAATWSGGRSPATTVGVDAPSEGAEGDVGGEPSGATGRRARRLAAEARDDRGGGASVTVGGGLLDEGGRPAAGTRRAANPGHARHDAGPAVDEGAAPGPGVPSTPDVPAAGAGRNGFRPAGGGGSLIGDALLHELSASGRAAPDDLLPIDRHAVARGPLAPDRPTRRTGGAGGDPLFGPPGTAQGPDPRHVPGPAPDGSAPKLDLDPRTVDSLAVRWDRPSPTDDTDDTVVFGVRGPEEAGARPHRREAGDPAESPAVDGSSATTGGAHGRHADRPHPNGAPRPPQNGTPTRDPASPAGAPDDRNGPRPAGRDASERGPGRPPSTDTDGLGLADLLAGALAAYRDL